LSSVGISLGEVGQLNTPNLVRRLAAFAALALALVDPCRKTIVDELLGACIEGGPRLALCENPTTCQVGRISNNQPRRVRRHVRRGDLMSLKLLCCDDGVCSPARSNLEQ
jgi:hypothetical protein